MRGKARPAGLLVLLCAFVVMAIGASSANAEFGIKKWEALTCKKNVDTPASGTTTAPGLPPLAQSGEQCLASAEGAEREEYWYTQASGHPNWGITDFELNNKIQVGPELFFEGFPDKFVKDIEVRLPEGLNVNPEAAPACTTEQAEKGEFAACAAATLGKAIVGTNYITVGLKPPTSGECVPAAPVAGTPSKCPQLRAAVPVFNVEPFPACPRWSPFRRKTHSKNRRSRSSSATSIRLTRA